MMYCGEAFCFFFADKQPSLVIGRYLNEMHYGGETLQTYMILMQNVVRLFWLSASSLLSSLLLLETIPPHPHLHLHLRSLVKVSRLFILPRIRIFYMVPEVHVRGDTVAIVRNSGTQTGRRAVSCCWKTEKELLLQMIFRVGGGGLRSV